MQDELTSCIKIARWDAKNTFATVSALLRHNDECRQRPLSRWNRTCARQPRHGSISTCSPKHEWSCPTPGPPHRAEAFIKQLSHFSVNPPPGFRRDDRMGEIIFAPLHFPSRQIQGRRRNFGWGVPVTPRQRKCWRDLPCQNFISCWQWLLVSAVPPPQRALWRFRWHFAGAPERPCGAGPPVSRAEIPE